MNLASLSATQRVIVCRHLLSGQRAAGYVEWASELQVTCGKEDHFGAKDGAVMCISEIIDSTPNLGQVTLKKRQMAELDESGHWVVKAMDEKDI